MINKVLKIIGCVFAVLLFLFGALIYSYPFINSCVVSNNSEETLRQFRQMKKIAETQKAKALDSQTAEGEDDNLSDSSQNFNKLYEDMRKYNLDIYINKQKNLKDAWSYEQSAFDLSAYGIYDGVVGELKIPKMNADLPIYISLLLH